MEARRVLIVDDNVQLAENIAEILEFDGHLTALAVSAEEALTKVPICTPEVVVTDYRLPGMNGAQLVRTLLSAGLRARAVVISAHTDDSTIQEATEAGAQFVPKPLDFKRLSVLVADAVA
ncbi:MAG TPA: response regulator [Polyangia bacterium]|nr:response regulator [Polyangia bacterium]